jgi:hypothetical protein
MVLGELLAPVVGAVVDRPVLASSIVGLLVVGVYGRHLADVFVTLSRWMLFATLAAVLVGVLAVAGVWTGALDAAALEGVLDVLGLAVTAVMYS